MGTEKLAHFRGTDALKQSYQTIVELQPCGLVGIALLADARRVRTSAVENILGEQRSGFGVGVGRPHTLLRVSVLYTATSAGLSTRAAMMHS